MRQQNSNLFISLKLFKQFSDVACYGYTHTLEHLKLLLCLVNIFCEYLKQY